MADATAASCARALISHHIARFGVPADITSDRGPQFTSNLWTALWTLLGAQLHRTTAYHPQANGVVERLHRQLKAALKARLVGPAWMDELPLVLLGLRSAPKEDLGCANSSMAQLSAFLGNSLKLQQPVTNQQHLSYSHSCAPPWLPYAQSRLLTTVNCPHMYLGNCRTAGLYSFAMTPTANPCSARTMDPSEFWSELPSISRWISW